MLIESPLAIALMTGTSFTLIAVLICIVLTPKKTHDQYSRPFGDVPKVPNG